MGKIKQTPEIEGERPFRCPMCYKQLLLDVKGECVLVLRCGRCKAKITLETAVPLPPALALRAGALLVQ